jgi:hypothetical protein
MIRARSDKVRRVCAEGTVPHPALMAMQCSFEWEGGGVALCSAWKLVAGLDIVRLRNVDGPDTCCVVGAAGRKVANVWGQENTRDVGVVCDEFADGDDGGYFCALDHFPDVDITLFMLAMPGDIEGVQLLPTYSVVSCADHAAIARDRDAGNADIVLGDQLV